MKVPGSNYQNKSLCQKADEALRSAAEILPTNEKSLMSKIAIYFFTPIISAGVLSGLLTGVTAITFQVVKLNLSPINQFYLKLAVLLASIGTGITVGGLTGYRIVSHALNKDNAINQESKVKQL